MTQTPPADALLDPLTDDKHAYPSLSTKLLWPAYAAVVLLAVVPNLIYVVAPDFYLRVILNQQMREYQLIEMTTFGAGLAAGAVLWVGAVKLWKRRPGRDYGPAGPRGLPDRLGAFAVVAASAAAVWFLAGEEVDWGQTFAHWGVPELEKDRDIILNLHNTTEIVSMQSLGSWFVNIVLLGIPVMWCFRRKLNLPRAWWPAIPIGPAVLALIMGTMASRIKDVYVWFTPDYETQQVYIDYIEQVNEQKEMMFAVGFLIMGLGVLAKLRKVEQSK